MPVTKTIVCLANSFRPGGSCVAGVEYNNGAFGDWIRPVSNRVDQAINIDEKTYANGTQVALLDVIEITFEAHNPEQHQTENWVISSGVRWRKVGQLSQAQAQDAVAPPNRALWGPAGSTYNGRKDELKAIFANAATSSLILIQPERATVEVINNPFSGEDHLWVSFIWADVSHKIKLTDPVQFQRFNTGAGASHTLEHPILCISLTKVWEKRGTASKLVAGLIA